MNSDHRTLWLDIPFTSILGFNPPNRPKPPPRRLKGKDPRVVEKYNKTTKKGFARADRAIPRMIHELKEMHKNNANKIDIILQHSQLLKNLNVVRLEAARRTRHIYAGAYEWSPEWRKRESQVKLWRVAKKRFHQRIRGRHLRRLMKKAGNEDCFTLNEQETIHRWEVAKAALDELKPKASEYRKEYLKQLAKALAAQKGTDEASELKKLTNQDEQRKLGAKLKLTSSKGQKGLATKLFIGPLENEEAVESKEGLEQVGANENESRFDACNHVSECLYDAQLAVDIGQLCEGPAVAQLMEGTYVPADHLSWGTKQILTNMKMPDCIRDNPMGPTHLPVKEHVQGWRKARENTASDPHSPDFSHYISASYDEALAELDALIREVPMHHGFAPEEWNDMTDLSIPKKEDVLRAELMRTIVLMPPPYNMNNKWYGRKFMKHNEALGTIPQEQAGSRKRHRSALVALKKVLSMDLLRQFRRAGFLCSNDAIQCYDRIAHNVAMLSMLRLGADLNTLQSLFGQLQNANHYIMTGLGLSETTYGGDKRKQAGKLPLQGVMQGNGMGPIIWLAISVLLISTMHSLGFATVFWSAMTHATLSMIGFIFVDDCDLIIAPPDEITSAQSYLPQFQKAVDAWEALLRATGGGLNQLNPSGISLTTNGILKPPHGSM